MNIKYLLGGVFNLPFVVYQPTDIPTHSESPTTSDKEKPESGIDMDEVYNLLDDLKEVLPGDLAAAKSKLASLFNTIELKLATGSDGLGGTSSIAYEYLSALTLVNKLKFAHNEYKTAQELAIASDSVNEYAINSRGQVIVATNEGFEWKTPEEIFKSNGKYIPITNQELLNYRAYGIGGLAFNSESLTTVYNSMGINEVTKLISDALDKLGSDLDSLDSYAKIKSGLLIKGLEDFIEAKDKSGNYNASIEDLVKANLLTLESAKQALLALNYIYNTLPLTAVSLLKMKSDGTAIGAKNMIDSLVYSKLSSKVLFSGLDLEGGPTKEDADKTGVKRSFLLDVQAGQGGYTAEFDLNNASNVKLSTNIDVYGAVKSLDGKYVDKTSMTDMLKKSGLVSIINPSEKIFFGNQEISEQNLEDILYQGGAFARAELPVDKDGNIRFDLLEIVERLELKLLVEPDKKAETVAEFFRENPSLQHYFSNDGSRRKHLFKPFLLFDGITTRDLIGINVDNKNGKINDFVVKVGSDRTLFENLKFHLTEANPSNAKKYKKDTYIFWGDPIYKGVVYLPLGMSKEAAIIGGNQQINYNDTKWELEHQMYQKGYELAPYIEGLIK